MAFGAGPAATPLPIGVELFVGGVWVDYTSDVVLMEDIEISRGKTSEGSVSDPGAMSLVLRSLAGKWSPRNPASALYGLIGRNTPIRAWIEHGLVVGTNRHQRFYGEVAEWPVRWTAEGMAYVKIECAGILRRLGQGAPLELSAYRAATRKTALTAYWPMEDGDLATFLTPEVGGAQGQFYGSAFDLAAYDGFTCSDPIPVLGTGRAVLPVPYAAPTAQWLVRFLARIPAAGTVNNAVLVRIQDSSFGYVDLSYNTGGGLTLTAKDNAGTTIATVGIGAFNVDGRNLQYQIEAKQSGANIVFAIAVLAPGEFIGGVLTATATNKTLGRPMTVSINPASAALTDVALGHVTVDDQVTSLFSLANALFAFSGETGVARITRLCAEAAVPFGAGAYVDSEKCGVQSRSNIVDLLQEAAEIEGGQLFESRSGAGLYLRPIESLYSMTPMASIPFGSGGRVDIEPTDDDQRTRNQVTVSRTDGASATVADKTGPLGVNTIGLYDASVSLPLYDDMQAMQHAGWRLNLGTVNEARWPVIGLDLAHPYFLADPTLTRNILLVNIGDMVEVTGLPAWLPPEAARGIVVGIKETIGPFSYRIEWNVIPSSPYRVPTWDAAGDRYDALGSTLSAGATSGATSLTVAHTGTRWTTTAGDFPFSIMVAGERMTVTNITGTSSPQTFTVTRSVNGVVKAQSSGAAVSLYDPVRFGL